MLASGLLDPSNLVGEIRRERIIHLVLFFVTLGGLVLFATCGMDTPIRTDVDEIQDTWMWYRYLFVISIIVPVILTEIYLLFSYRALYLIQWAGHLYSVCILIWAFVAAIIVLANCDQPDGGQPKYPQCDLATFTYVVRFCTLGALLFVRVVSWWNTSNLRNTVENIRRMRSMLVKTSAITTDEGSARDAEMAEIYNQIRNEQILHAIAMLLIGVAWGFFAVSEMWLVFRYGRDDVWVSWIWWRNFLTLMALFPMGWTQLYFLLGGTLSRWWAKWGNYIWVLGVLPVHAVYFFYIYDNCNQIDPDTVTLVHPECGTPNLLDDSVMPSFLWRMASFFALFGACILQLLTYQSVTHSLMTLAMMKKARKAAAANAVEEELETGEVALEANQITKRIAKRIGDVMPTQVVVTRKNAPQVDDFDHRDLDEHTNTLLHKWLHHDSIGATFSQATHPASLNEHFAAVQTDAPSMLLFPSGTLEQKKYK